MTPERIPERIPDLPIDTYHGNDSVSSSGLRLLPDEPDLYYRRYVAKTDEVKPTSSMRIGTDLHRALQGVPFQIIPDDVLSSNGARAGGAWKDYSVEHADKVLIKSFADVPYQQHSAAMADEKIQAMHSLDGTPEVSYFWEGLRARPDLEIRCASWTMLVDYKSCSHLTVTGGGFDKSLGDGELYRQADLQIRGYEAVFGEPPDYYYWIAFGTTSPWRVRRFRARPKYLAMAHDDNDRALVDLETRLKTEDWKPEAEGKELLAEMPKWHRYTWAQKD